MTLTSTLVLLSLLAVYNVAFSYYVCKELGTLKRQSQIDVVNTHAFGDYVDDNLYTVHNRIDDLETLLVNATGKRTVSTAAVKAVNTGRSASKAAAKKAVKKAAVKKAPAKKAAAK
jgi:topoisomerase IA-like protein